MRVRLRTRGEWAFNAWLGALLCVAVVVAANRLAKSHLRLRADLSEEKLFAPSPVGERMLGSLEDVLSVKAFFTGDVKLGMVQIAKGRLLDQLHEYRDAARGRMDLVLVDPNSSTEAEIEGEAYGIESVRLTGTQGTTQVTQEIFLGLVLRYRGREAVVPWVLPQTFPYLFLSNLARLMREEPLAVGFLSGAGDAEVEDRFQAARKQIARRYPLRELVGLADGDAVPPDVRLVIVARPDELHPRAAFELDQFVQRGGRLLILAETVSVDLEKPEARLITTGIDEVLAAWGVALDPGLVWDQQASYVRFGDRTLQYPFWVEVDDHGMERSVPVTGQLPGANFFWTHEVVLQDVPGVEPLSLVRSSESSWTVAADDALATGGTELGARAIDLLASETPRRHDLAIALSGAFPSAFAAGGAPEPRDAVREALRREAVRAAHEAGVAPPPREVPRTDEPVLSGAAAGGSVVVFGDADWITDGEFFTVKNQLMLENLVDWLLLEHELVALRASLPRERRIRDFLREEKEARGLPVLAGDDVLAQGVDPALVDAAERAAERRRRLAMAQATGGALAVATALALLGRFALAGRWR